MEERYFIINANDPNINAIIAFCIGDLDTQRYSLDKSKLVVKLFSGDETQHPELEGYTEYNHTEILIEMQGDEWVSDEL